MQGKEGGWVVEEASHAVKCWLNVTCNVLTPFLTGIITVVCVCVCVHACVCVCVRERERKTESESMCSSGGLPVHKCGVEDHIEIRRY